MRIDDVIDAVETAVEGAAVTTDSGGAPAQFAGLDTGELEADGQERNFIVEVVSLDKVDGTGTTGQCNRRVRLSVKVKYINEGRGRRAMQSLIFSDATRIQDRVEVALNATTGVGVCYSEPGASSRPDYEESTVEYLAVPFVVEYVDDLVTS